MQWIGNVDVNFYLGLTLGVGIFMAGFLFGRITTGDSIVAKVRKVFSREQYHDPGEVYDDAFFERARYSPMEGGLQYDHEDGPSDEELEDLARHSSN